MPGPKNQAAIQCPRGMAARPTGQMARPITEMARPKDNAWKRCQAAIPRSQGMIARLDRTTPACFAFKGARGRPKAASARHSPWPSPSEAGATLQQKVFFEARSSHLDDLRPCEASPGAPFQGRRERRLAPWNLNPNSSWGVLGGHGRKTMAAAPCRLLGLADPGLARPRQANSEPPRPSLLKRRKPESPKWRPRAGSEPAERGPARNAKKAAERGPSADRESQGRSPMAPKGSKGKAPKANGQPSMPGAAAKRLFRRRQ